MVVVDASVWVALFVPADTHHAVGSEWFDEQLAQQELLLAPSLVLPEVAGAIARRLNSQEIASEAISAIRELSQVWFIEIDHEMTERSWQLAAELRMRGADAVYTAVAQRYSAPLVTLDRQQAERASGRVEVRFLGR